MSTAAAPAAGAGSASEGASSSSAGFDPKVVGFDPKEAIADIKRTRGETQKLASAFDSHRQEVQGDREILQKLKSVFSPEEASAPDPIAHLEGQMDQFLEQAMELKARGQQIPLTTQIALNFYQSQLENLKTINALKAELKDVKGGVERANDPEAPVNNMAYTQMDTFIQQSLDSLYGTDQKQLATKRRLYQTVTSALSEDLKAMQAQRPAEWDMFRRNPAKLQSLVNDVLRTIVPPRAMAMLEQEEIKNTPMSAKELWGAFNEAREMFKNAKTEEQRKKALGLQREIRQEIFDLDKKGRAKRR